MPNLRLLEISNVLTHLQLVTIITGTHRTDEFAFSSDIWPRLQELRIQSLMSTEVISAMSIISRRSADIEQLSEEVAEFSYNEWFNALKRRHVDRFVFEIGR